MNSSDKLKMALTAVIVAVLAYYGVAKSRTAPPPAPVPSPSKQAAASDLAGGKEKDTRILGEFDLARLYPESVLRQGNPGRKVVALTFDDGPDNQYTPQVLDILAQKGVKATFFLIGKRLAEAPSVVKRIMNDGHDVGNHTFNHPNISHFSHQDVEREVRTADEELRRFGVEAGGMFRPPYGAVAPDSIEPLARSGYRLYLWSVDSLDWRGLNRDQIVGNVIPQVTSGSVILFHSAGGPGEDLTGTVQALPIIIDDLRAKGFTFATLHEMFQAKPRPARQG